eukprot:GEMP01105790.1.p1 GENE.GEMP01105790.1~~GEMP01105790.1.p1  ORF type:complete len:109 (+),score=3.23 GEMP01105790.1:369-695(+)
MILQYFAIFYIIFLQNFPWRIFCLSFFCLFVVSTPSIIEKTARTCKTCAFFHTFCTHLKHAIKKTHKLKATQQFFFSPKHTLLCGVGVFFVCVCVGVFFLCVCGGIFF